MDDNTEERVGPYQIVKKLTSGGMAEIFLTSARQGQHYIVKRILKDYCDSDDFITMFLNEAKLSVNLHHSNIVQVYDFGNYHGNYFLAMEYIFGKDLGSILKYVSENRLFIPVDIAVYVAQQICMGLDYAHFKRDAFNKHLNIVHRDISPPNIMLAFDGSIKILDFGIAKATAMTSALQTRSGVLKGKFSYMSPEQAYGKEIDRRTDIFSTGIVLYEMLTCRSLFYSHDDIEILEKVRKAKVAPPSQLNPKIPPKLDKIVLTALARKSKHRYQTAHDFGEALRVFLNEAYPTMNRATAAAYLQSIFSEEFREGLQQHLASPDITASSLLTPAGDKGLFLDELEHTGVSEVNPTNPNTNLPPPVPEPPVGFVRRHIGALVAACALLTLAASALWLARYHPIEPSKITIILKETIARTPDYVASFYTVSKAAWQKYVTSSAPHKWQEQIWPQSEKKKELTPEAYLETGERYFNEGNFRKAAPYLAWAVKSYPLNYGVKAKLAIAYIRINEVQRGCGLVPDGMPLNTPLPPLFYLVQGLCYEYGHEKQLALGAYKTYLEKDTSSLFRDDVLKIIRNLN